MSKGWSVSQKEAIRKQLKGLYELGYDNGKTVDEVGFPYLNNESVKEHIEETLLGLEAITKGSGV